MTDGKVWVKDWIGETAPEVFIERWWRSAELSHHGWESYFSASGFDLIGKEVLVKLKDGDYGMDVEEVRSLDYVEKTQEKPAKTNTKKDVQTRKCYDCKKEFCLRGGCACDCDCCGVHLCMNCLTDFKCRLCKKAIDSNVIHWCSLIMDTFPDVGGDSCTK